ncbi:MAG TPA: hypothetical protein VEG60_10600 [Candidatus Binatia bacterium]|nr:hypothetical protein [Candidatus Binatia bacterium]
MNAKTPSALPKAKIRFIEPMYARLVNELPESKEWLYEVKFDGYRCLAGRDSTGVTLWSRRGNLFTNQFPHIARGCENMRSETMIDGEIVAIDDSGRVSFNASQYNRPRAHIQFYAFDVLIHLGCKVTSLSLEARRELGDFDGSYIRVNSIRGRVKDQNMRRNNLVALTIVDPDMTPIDI